MADSTAAPHRVLILCTGNSCRSQMAEGWVNHLLGGRWQAHSAGTRPAAAIHPLAVKVMAEVGIDISGGRPEHVDRYLERPWDLVITVCDSARESCPMFPRPVEQVHLSFPDPAEATGGEEERMAVFRAVRDDIRARLTGELERRSSVTATSAAVGIEGRPVVLFLCTANSCRSQMAQGFLHVAAGDRFEVLSAGINPADSVHPLAVQVMAERGIDISRQRPAHARDYLGRVSVRTVIIVCNRAAEACPTTWPFVAERLVWPFEDPAAFTGDQDARLAKFREVRDAIEARLLEWLRG